MSMCATLLIATRLTVCKNFIVERRCNWVIVAGCRDQDTIRSAVGSFKIAPEPEVSRFPAF